MAGKKIFISYSRADTDYVSNLVETLRQKGFDVWFDKNIRTGSEWDNTIEKEIKAADAMVLVLSKTSVASDNVKDEMSYAMQLSKSVNPIKIEECDVPMRLARKQFLDFTEIGYEGGVSKLVDDINHNLNVPHIAKETPKPSLSSSESSSYKRVSQPKARSNKKLFFIGAAVVALLAILYITNAITFKDASDDFAVDKIEGASADDVAWNNALSINSIKGYLDYFAKYSEDGKHLQEASDKMDELSNAEGVVLFSEIQEGNKENYFHIYKGGFEDETSTPEVGQYIISLRDNVVDRSLNGGMDSGDTIQKDQIASVLQVRDVEGEVLCKIAYHQ